MDLQQEEWKKQWVHKMRCTKKSFVSKPKIVFLQLRPEMNVDNNATILFHQLDVEHHPKGLQMFGSTSEGQSVSCFIKNVPSQKKPKLRGSNWIKLRPGMYEMKTEEKQTRCQIEVNVDSDNILIENQLHKHMAPFRILSIEVEVAKNGKGYPDSSRDSVLSIAGMVIRDGDNKPFVRCLFTTSACGTIGDTQVWICKDERELLQQWVSFVDKTDPDIITGYSVYLCDFGFIRDRLKILGLPEWKTLGRIIKP